VTSNKIVISPCFSLVACFCARLIKAERSEETLSKTNNDSVVLESGVSTSDWFCVELGTRSTGAQNIPSAFDATETYDTGRVAKHCRSSTTAITISAVSFPGRCKAYRTSFYKTQEVNVYKWLA
jgi:hypothetical protein